MADSSEKTLRLHIVKDMRAGLRTKAILQKHSLSLVDFERILKNLIKEGAFSIEEYKAWKAKRGPATTMGPPMPDTPRPDPPPDKDPTANGEAYPKKKGKIVETYVIEEPEKNHAWALQLFSIKKEAMRGANFKVMLHGKKYSFTVEDLLYRGVVNLKENHFHSQKKKMDEKDRREEAISFIAKHGWAAFLEARAFEANFGEDDVDETPTQARLVVLHCKHDTFLAALHTPTPAISFYVSTSLESVLERLSKSVETNDLRFENQ